jgi:hypothetical protein
MYWKSTGEYGVETKNNLRYKFEKTPFHASLLGNGLNRF